MESFYGCYNFFMKYGSVQPGGTLMKSKKNKLVTHVS